MFDNKRPTDTNYPTFEPAEFLGDNVIYVNEGDYIVDMNGDIEIVTAGNMKWKDSTSPLVDMNYSWIRAKYLGNNDDALECANQIRLATPQEILLSSNYGNARPYAGVTSNGQLTLI